MVTITPNYYMNFKCIADKCRHTCCAGWEIEIDDETLSALIDSLIELTNKVNV